MSKPDFIPGRRWIYVISQNAEEYKIGTTESFHAWWKGYTTHNPKKLVTILLQTCLIDKAGHIEEFVKNALIDKRVGRSREWFKTSGEDIIASVRRAMNRAEQPRYRYTGDRRGGYFWTAGKSQDPITDIYDEYDANDKLKFWCLVFKQSGYCGELECHFPTFDKALDFLEVRIWEYQKDSLEEHIWEIRDVGVSDPN